MIIYINIDELMKNKGLTAVKLAELSGLTPEHISVIKNGKTKKIELSTIEKLLKAIDCEPNDLFKFSTAGKKQ